MIGGIIWHPYEGFVDDGIERALQIGEANAKVIELAKNWCAHLEVEKSGGTGIVEAQTGLPIGMRSFKCVHACAAGFAGMALESIVLDFYDRNCIGCTKRVPVRLPNLSQLVSDREKAADAAKRMSEAAARKERLLYEARQHQRKALSENADEATRDDLLQFLPQTVQYVAGSDRRFGILCVLDGSVKKGVPGSVADDISYEATMGPSGTGLPIGIGTVIIRGNLSKPSTLRTTKRPLRK